MALKVEGAERLVVETGLYNLTNDELPVLIHFGADRQEARTLIRLQPPEDRARDNNRGRGCLAKATRTL